jgi:hypothetical protein
MYKKCFMLEVLDLDKTTRELEIFLDIFETRPSILATLVQSSISSQPRNVLFS